MIYLIESSSYHLLNEEIKKIIKNNNYETFDLSNINITELLNELTYSSLFDETRYIIVRNADIFSAKDKTNSEQFIKFLNNYQGANIIIFTTYLSVDERKKITKLMKEKHQFLKIKVPQYSELNKKLKKYLQENKKTITDDALNFIINNCNNNYDVIINELDKLTLLDIPNITLAIANETCSHILNNNNFKFLDAVLNKNLSLSVKLFNEYKIKRQEPIILLVLLAREYHNLYLIKKYDQLNYSEKKMLSKLNLAPWQIEKYHRLSFEYTLKEIEDNILYLADIDYQIKSGKISSSLGIEMFILKNI